MDIVYNKSVPKHIKGMIQNFIKQKNIKALDNLEIFFCYFNVIINSEVFKSGNYFCEYENKLKSSYSQIITIDII